MKNEILNRYTEQARAGKAEGIDFPSVVHEIQRLMFIGKEVIEKQESEAFASELAMTVVTACAAAEMDVQTMIALLSDNMKMAIARVALVAIGYAVENEIR